MLRLKRRMHVVLEQIQIAVVNANPGRQVHRARVIPRSAEKRQHLAALVIKLYVLKCGVDDVNDPVVVNGDRDELVRVAENLIENAIKYGGRPEAPGGDRVEVSVTKTAAEGWISVRDFGRGIAPEHLPRLTERFYRVDPGQSRAKNGTGLGLAIVKHILARHRGRLTITSRPDHGSTFTAAVPLRTQ